MPRLYKIGSELSRPVGVWAMRSRGKRVFLNLSFTTFDHGRAAFDRRAGGASSYRSRGGAIDGSSAVEGAGNCGSMRDVLTSMGRALSKPRPAGGVRAAKCAFAMLAEAGWHGGSERGRKQPNRGGLLGPSGDFVLERLRGTAPGPEPGRHAARRRPGMRPTWSRQTSRRLRTRERAPVEPSSRNRAP